MILYNVIKANFLKQEKHARFFRSLLKVKKFECLKWTSQRCLGRYKFSREFIIPNYTRWKNNAQTNFKLLAKRIVLTT